MPTCQHCGKKWSWGQTVKTLFRLKCPHCGEKQYESASSRMKSGAAMVIPTALLPMVLSIVFDFSMVTAFILIIVIAAAMLSVYPFMLELSDEWEPYW